MTSIGNRARAYLTTLVIFVACAAAMAVMSSARPPAATSAEKPETVERLTAPKVVQNVPCEGYARFDADGTLVSCTLSEEHDFGHVVLPAHTQVRRFHPDRNGGDRSHERRLGEVIEAYQTLRKSAAFA